MLDPANYGRSALVIDMIGADILIEEANPSARASATLTLEEAKQLATRIKSVLLRALWESIA